jgi:hypothetical protein
MDFTSAQPAGGQGRTGRSDAEPVGRLQSQMTLKYFDEGFPQQEQLPRQFEALFDDDGRSLHLSVNGNLRGDPLTDKARSPDGYRFHDAFHICNAAVLWWSPVLRSVLQRRRRSNPVIDEVEDGGRAQMIEEAICHVIYDHGRDHDLSCADDIDIKFVSYIKRLAGGLEVATCSLVLFSRAISLGYSTFANLRSFGGGRLSVNLITRNLTFYPPK